MTITGRLAAAGATVLMLWTLPAAPSWGQQSVLRSQTDEVQRAISETLRQANGQLRRNAAPIEPPRTPEEPAPTTRSDGAAQPAPRSDRQ